MIWNTKSISATGAAIVGLALGWVMLTDRGHSDVGRPVLAAAIGPGNARQQLFVAGLGVVEPRDGLIDIAPQMAGIVAAIHVTEGDVVQLGDPVADLISDDLKANLDQAKALIDLKTAQLDRLLNGSRPQEVAQARGQVSLAQATLAMLTTQHERRRGLAQLGAVSQESLDSAANALAAGQQAYDSAVSALSLLEEGPRLEDLEAARADLVLAQHQFEAAQADLAKATILAPSDGTVLRMETRLGEAVSPQQATGFAQMGDISQLVVRTQIDEGDIGALQVGQTAQISAAALGGKTLSGRVTRISARLGAATITSGAPTEKRDSRVLEIIVALDAGVTLPVGLRVDVLIDVES